MIPAGFWRRHAAWSLDAVLIAMPILLIAWRPLHAAAARVGAAYTDLLQQAAQRMADALADGAMPVELAQRWLGDAAMRAAMAELQAALLALSWPPLLAFAIIGALYHVVFETSARQATPGQRALGLLVTDAAGLRCDALRALGRHVAGTLSWLTLNIGHAMTLAPRGLALHDIVSRTRVVRTRNAPPRIPVWALAWLFAQGIALLWLTIAAMVATRATLQSALDAPL